MSGVQQLDFSYFPGCSLATTAAESNRSMMERPGSWAPA
jgi:hypothetical protein